CSMGVCSRAVTRRRPRRRRPDTKLTAMPIATQVPTHIPQNRSRASQTAIRDVRTLLANLTLIDGTGAGPATGAWLLVDGDRIAEVGRGPGPLADARVDLEGRTCVPGLIDLHVHLCWDGSADPADVNRREGEELTLLRMARHARDTLERGVTTVRDVGSIADLSLVLGRAIRSGIVPGPRPI